MAEVHWSGANSSAVMVLMKDNDDSLSNSRPSFFYVSYDDGKTFINKVRKYIEHTFTELKNLARCSNDGHLRERARAKF